jgi:GxxExxY protein
MDEDKSPRAFSRLSHRVIGCAIEVHRHLGPGLLEATYQQCLAHELRLQSIEFHVECPLPVVYKKVRLDCGYRIDLLIENALIIELKSVEQIQGLHRAQLITYMKLAKINEGLLINFNVEQLKHGLRHFSL